VTRLIECVANFSEGRDRARVDRIAAAVASVPGAEVLDIHIDADHHRSVITFAGEPDPVAEAAVAAVGCAAELIDLRAHRGVHPRIGAADVVPFVPVEGVTLEECAAIAHRVGERIWHRHGIPVYFYEAAARVPERQRLEQVRHGGFEGLLEAAVTDSSRAPDVGGPALHPTAGAVVVGARKFLIAYNINLATGDLAVARAVAAAVRESSGGLKCVKAMGVLLASRNRAQVTMNLTDFEVTPVHRVFEAVREEAARRGVSIEGSEIIGLVPRRVLEMTAEYYLKVENFTPGVVLENRLAERPRGGAGA